MVATNCLPMCVIPTFDKPTRSMAEMLAAGDAVSTAAMHEEQATALNPDLAKCGTLPGCRSCNLLFGAQVLEVGERVAEAVRRIDLA